jgi:Flp pilus assembly protein TadD
MPGYIFFLNNTRVIQRMPIATTSLIVACGVPAGIRSVSAGDQAPFHVSHPDGYRAAFELFTSTATYKEHLMDAQTGGSNLRPELITKPMQLLAGSFLLPLAFLGSAGYLVRYSSGLAIFLTAMATIIAFLIVILLFVLMTRHRDQLLAGSDYLTMQKMRIEQNRLARELQVQLDRAHFNLGSLATGQSLSDVAPEVQRTIVAQAATLEQAVRSVPVPTTPSHPEVSPEAILELAKVRMAQKNWAEAASLFDVCERIRPLDWEGQFARGVSHANARQGFTSDLAALRAYNEAIALMPPELPDYIRARLFTYRGAILKRLRRLDEAEVDLLTAQRLGPSGEDELDLYYNFAGVYALKGRRDEMMWAVSALKDSPRYLVAIRSHLRDYFAAFATDEEFLKSISLNVRSKIPFRPVSDRPASMHSVYEPIPGSPAHAPLPGNPPHTPLPR